MKLWAQKVGRGGGRGHLVASGAHHTICFCHAQQMQATSLACQHCISGTHQSIVPKGSSLCPPKVSYSSAFWTRDNGCSPGIGHLAPTRSALQAIHTMSFAAFLAICRWSPFNNCQHRASTAVHTLVTCGVHQLAATLATGRCEKRRVRSLWKNAHGWAFGM